MRKTGFFFREIRNSYRDKKGNAITKPFLNGAIPDG
jgi:hypothetical protein